MKMILFVAALSLAGCSKKASTSACNDAVGKAVDQMMSRGKAQMAAMRAKLTPDQQKEMDARASKMDEIAGKLKDVFSKDCVEQKWSSDMIACVKAATSQREMAQCNDKLPKDQADKLKADAMQVMMSEMGGMGGMHGMHGGMPHAMPPGGAPAGSAAPEAGSAGGAMGGAGSATEGSAAPAPAAPAPAGSGK
jgi:hypothetical protein